MKPHGIVLHRFVKNENAIEQVLVIYEDGCIESIIKTLPNRGTTFNGASHTAELFKWGRQTTAKTLAESGFNEDFDDIL